MNRRFVIFSLLLVLAASIFSAGCISPDVPNVSDNPDVQENYEQALSSLTNPPTGYKLLEAPIYVHVAVNEEPSPKYNIVYVDVFAPEMEGWVYAMTLDGAVMTPIKTGMLIQETNGHITHITMSENQDLDQIKMSIDDEMNIGEFTVLELRPSSYSIVYRYVSLCIDAEIVSRYQ
ncbi:MAG TPA: hypothetical protein O0X21_01415 [Methanocorpusculum sp.]|jgi:hypothetical protein|nr:hypothetical protein [Methanocorpusculum sp.]MEE1136491.1 hypothetical protein [Methanocorpusculum sp.]HJJ68747.1 hypothetical protein [Methanocorpusculum sp.]HJJ73750.1 hypothetical protein [Methanocorpusculum sp.]HJJ77800.1 hypothetical protein [Methanocorpusculum sp.]